MKSFYKICVLVFISSILLVPAFPLQDAFAITTIVWRLSGGTVTSAPLNQGDVFGTDYVTVRVDDSDLDTNGSPGETINVQLTSTTGDSFTLTLTETADTGIFDSGNIVLMSGVDRFSTTDTGTVSIEDSDCDGGCNVNAPCKYDPKNEGKPDSCKSENPYHGNTMGKNTASKYADEKKKKEFIPNWDKRIWFGGAEEFTSELARQHFLANAMIINSTFQNLPDESFIDDPKNTKEIYKKSIKKVVSLIEQHNYVGSTEELESLLGTVDGQHDDDLIRPEFTNKSIKLLKNSISGQEPLGTGGIIKAEKKEIFSCKNDQVLDNSGLCIKKSELCKPNQILDETGTCVPKGNFCGSGTVYKDGICLMEGKSPGKQDLSIIYGSIGAVIASVAFAIIMASKYTSLKSKISK